MEELTVRAMLEMQKELQERYKDKWEAICPEHARNKLLWMIGEAGEAADVIKKKGDEAICRDPETRRHFVEELCDVAMYWNDILLCYGIDPSEVEEEYRRKHEADMHRW